MTPSKSTTEVVEQYIRLSEVAATDPFHVYLPAGRVQALARGETLPDRTQGTALFADISGFTPLEEMVVT